MSPYTTHIDADHSRVPSSPVLLLKPREATVRTFSCFTFDDRRSVPTLFFLFAEDETRVRLLARRELLATPHASSIEICEGAKLLWIETAALPPARKTSRKGLRPPRARTPRQRPDPS
jgi:hypothetical protein